MYIYLGDSPTGNSAGGGGSGFIMAGTVGGVTVKAGVLTQGATPTPAVTGSAYYGNSAGLGSTSPTPGNPGRIVIVY